MSEFLALVPPAAIVLLAALVAAVAPRGVGHGAGVAALLAVVAVSLWGEPGRYYDVQLFGTFDVVLFNVDEFAQTLGLVFGILGAAAVLYAYSSDAPRLTTALALSYVGSTMGVLFAGDWLTLLLFWELMAVTSTVLVWHYGGDAVRAGYRYALAHGIGGSLLLFAVAWHFARTGSFLFPTGEVGSIAGGLPLALAVLAIGINCGFIGLHTWLPDTYPRPHLAASVFLSVFTTKTGAYVMYRALPTEESVALAVAYMGAAMAVYGVVFALLQHDMRALLTYHIQAQVGYIMAGIGMGLYFGGDAVQVGVGGAMAHIFNNVLFKALLFMAVGVIIYRTGIEDLYELGGLWRKMPLTALGFGLGALSITAVPGFNGFISKGMILDTANPSYFGGGNDVIYWLLMIGAVGTYLSFIKLGYYAFLNGRWDGMPIRDAKPGQTVAMLSIGGLCLLFGVWWTGLVDALPYPVVGDVAPELHPYSVGHLEDAVLLAVVSVVGFALIKRPLAGIGHIRDPATIVTPLVFYAGKASVYAVTAAYAAIDRLGVRIVRRCYWAAANPVVVAHRATRWLPESSQPSFGVGDRRADGDAPSRIYIRADIGTTILLLVAVLTVVLWLLL